MNRLRLVRLAFLTLCIVCASAACGATDQGAVDTAPSQTEPTATVAPAEVVAVDANPIPVGGAPASPAIADNTDADTSTAATEASTAQGAALNIGGTRIVVPASWVPIDNAQALSDFLADGTALVNAATFDDSTIAEWTALLANDMAAMAVDPDSGHSASLIITPQLGELSPTDDPEGWIVNIGTLMTETVPGLSYQGEPAREGGHAGVRAAISMSSDGIERSLQQFTVTVGDELVTVTVSGQVDRTTVDQIFSSLTAG